MACCRSRRRPKQPRLEGPSAAEVFRHLMLLDLYRYAVQALNFFPGNPLVALTPPPQPPAPTVAVRAFYGETTVKRSGNSSRVSARCGKSGPSLRTVTVFASAAHVATKRMLADITRSVLDKLSVMMRSSLEGTAFFGHTFQTSAFKLREHVDSFCSKRNSTGCQNASNFLTGRIPQQSLAVTFPPPPALAAGSN